MQIVWLGESACHERALVGGKAAHLSRLAERWPVPPGFCLTTEAFERWAGRERAASVPPELAERLVEAYRLLGERCGEAEPSVAVRSSAVDEDSQGVSFAGLHDTFLNVVGADALVEAVGRCWASLYTERALEYRRQHGLSVEQSRLAVLVQQLVPADVSMVVFSANPVSGSREELVINASYGLGESIVGGTVTPDTYVVRRSDRQVSEERLADKRRMTVAVPGGTREVDVPRLLRSQPALDQRQIAELVSLALDLERQMGWPVDLECVYQGDKLFLVQCRPVTTVG